MEKSKIAKVELNTSYAQFLVGDCIINLFFQFFNYYVSFSDITKSSYSFLDFFKLFSKSFKGGSLNFIIVDLFPHKFDETQKNSDEYVEMGCRNVEFEAIEGPSKKQNWGVASAFFSGFSMWGIGGLTKFKKGPIFGGSFGRCSMFLGVEIKGTLWTIWAVNFERSIYGIV